MGRLMFLQFVGIHISQVSRNEVREVSCGMDIYWDAENRNSSRLWRPSCCRLPFVA